MFDDIKLTKLPLQGKLFAALLSVLIILAAIWMLVMGVMDAYDVGEIDRDYTYIDAEEAIEDEIDAIIDDEQAVTAPDWSDSGQQEPIEPDDEEMFEEYAEEELPFWEIFHVSIAGAAIHLTLQTLLFFAVGLMFLFTGYSLAIKKFFFWVMPALIVIHAIGMTGYGFCWPAQFIGFFFGTAVKVMFVVMAVMILNDMRK